MEAFTVGNIPQVAAHSESTTTCGPPASPVSRSGGGPRDSVKVFRNRSSLNGYYRVFREGDMEFLPAYVTNAVVAKRGPAVVARNATTTGWGFQSSGTSGSVRFCSGSGPPAVSLLGSSPISIVR